MELKEGVVMVLGDGSASYESEEDFAKFAASEKWMHFVCMSMRPGIEELVTKLEYTHYKPLTSRNDLFHMRALLWNDIAWLVFSVPIGEKHLVEEMAKLCGMRVANGIPTMFGAGCRTHFPISGKNVFTMENASGHPVYQNDDRINCALREAETRAAEDIRSGKDKKAN